METENDILAMFRFSAEWTLLSFCYLILFHLFPTLVAIPVLTVDRNLFTPIIVWYLTGIAGVGITIGFQRKDWTIAEPAVASALYAVALAFLLRWNVHPGWRNEALTTEHLVLLFIVAVIGIFLAMIASVCGRLLRRFRTDTDSERPAQKA